MVMGKEFGVFFFVKKNKIIRKGLQLEGKFE